MLKVVFDTNVIVSSLWGGNPKKILDFWREGSFDALTSNDIISEYLLVLSRFDLSFADMNEWAWNFQKKMVLIAPHRKTFFVKEDADDNKFIDCALSGNADYIVSGDKHLLDLRKFSGIKIVKPAEFLKKVNQ
ncbi:putative toxin-antitoxin system toxin component, PIN family [candidate division WOR-1 bacterium RIFOXYA2_FULL_36_21]|uniref:Putative toxin-antitoxin system toxin component, PIN family n=1 Tax=candidate division WOR-1 bacterium RIFOXYB2_FULL_36_35 TaxID=1802578 RepID=A0A1F4RZ09_UNCSA|nr:MAG: putative toxin-antitoxin system toxin component, PIN family [candidate division WOR-1 bacterium RIFOXYA2_FULL_36_21]OGC13412.1 MAG: putative toxin-antitoxin system toxin component, PIN family [candidate division WOR-1 bacterium RIFOXYB2_FULL_36_35]OGC14306.1 MAG: putative toxin-antitoxin system toxin component, PIN family [candidate division WOR-1 bacterium RIFOXYA12_FULL_36_13]